MEFQWLTTYLTLGHSVPFHVIRTLIHHLLFCHPALPLIVELMVAKRCRALNLPMYVGIDNPHEGPNLRSTDNFTYGMFNINMFAFTTSSTHPFHTSGTLEIQDDTFVFAHEGNRVSPFEFFTILDKIIS